MRNNNRFAVCMKTDSASSARQPWQLTRLKDAQDPGQKGRSMTLWLHLDQHLLILEGADCRKSVSMDILPFQAPQVCHSHPTSCHSLST